MRPYIHTYNIDNPAIHWEPPDQGWVVFVVVAE